MYWGVSTFAWVSLGKGGLTKHEAHPGANDEAVWRRLGSTAIAVLDANCLDVFSVGDPRAQGFPTLYSATCAGNSAVYTRVGDGGGGLGRGIMGWHLPSKVTARVPYI